MYHTKAYVDKHVSSILANVRNDSERKNRGYQIARLYYDVKEYDIAKRYLCGYLTVKENYAPAHKLHGQIFESQKQTAKALDAFKRSLTLDDSQKDVLLNVCELCLKIDIDPERAKYWADRAERAFPQHNIVFRLREHVFAGGSESATNSDLESLLVTELARRPEDASLRAKLLRLLVGAGRVCEAYDHAVDTERKVRYPDNRAWYGCVLEVLTKYQSVSGEGLNGTFHQWLLWTLHKLTSLSVAQAKVSETIGCLHSMDQTLDQVKKLALASEEWVVFVQEMQAQVFYHAANTLFKCALKEPANWGDICDLAAACYLVSYTVKPLNTNAHWFVRAAADEKKIYDQWHSEACLRCSQAGHMLRRLAGGNGQAWVARIQLESCSHEGKEKLFQILFSRLHNKSASDTSFLINNAMFTTFNPEMPLEADLMEFDEVVSGLRMSSLQQLVWTALQYYTVRDKTQPNYKVQLPADLRFGVMTLDTDMPESLSQLDLLAFLYAVVRTTALQRTKLQLGHAREQPDMMPVALTTTLCTNDQKEWWSTAISLASSTSKSQLSQQRRILLRGLGVIRLLGQHGVDLDTMVHLAQTFTERFEEARALPDHSVPHLEDINLLQARAQHYWQATLRHANALTTKKNLRAPKSPLFENQDCLLTDVDVIAIKDTAHFQVASAHLEEEEYEEAIKGFEGINLPEASYHTAEAYKKLAMSRKVSSSSDGDEAQIALLCKARDALYQTLDRLQGDRLHDLNSVVAGELDAIETRLAILEGHDTDEVGSAFRTPPHADPVSELPLRGSTDLPSAPNFSQSTPSHNKLNSSTFHQSFPHHCRPSPERLDAQLKSLAYSQDSIVKPLIEELRESRKINQKQQDRISVLENEKRQLERQVFELQKTGTPAYPHPGTPAYPHPGNPAYPHPGNPAYPGTVPPVPAAHAMPPHMPPHMMDPWAATSPRQPMAGGFYGSPQMRPEYDFMSPHAAMAGHPAYQPTPAQITALAQQYSYPGMAPPHPQANMAHPPHMPQQVPARAPGPTHAHPGAYVAPPPQQAPQFPSNDAEEEGDYYVCDDDDEEEEDDGDGGLSGSYIPESKDWFSAGNQNDGMKSGTGMKNEQVAQRVPFASGNTGATSGTAIPRMPGPGFFSSPDRLTQQPLPGVSGVLITNPTAMIGGQLLPPAVPPMGVFQVAPPHSSLVTGMPLPSVSTANKFPMAMPAGAQRPPAHLLATEAVTASNLATTLPALTQALGPSRAFGSPEKHHEDEGDLNISGGPDFTPIVSLAEVAVVTGEENEVAFCEVHGKLFRFEDRQWKERGIGNIKVLQDSTSKQMRILMRRDQVHKVCANHYIKPDMTIDFKSAADDRTLTWRALDFSDNEPRPEQFCCKFRTNDLAAEFKVAFEKARDIATAAAMKNEKQESPAKSKSQFSTAGLGQAKPETTPAFAASSAQSGIVFGEKKDLPANAVPAVTATATAAATAAEAGFAFSSNFANQYRFGASFSTGTTNTSSASASGFGSPALNKSSASGSATSISSTSKTPAADMLKSMASKAGEVKETPVAASIASSIPVATTNKPTSSSIPVFTTTKPTLNSIPVATTKPTFGGAAFGGFTFTQTPVVSKTEEKQIEKTISAPVAVKVEEKAITKPVNPFASFSFGSPKTATNTPNTGATTTPSTTKNELVATMSKPSVFGPNPSGATPTFGSIAAAGKTEAFAKPSGVSFSGGSTLFKAPTSQKPEPKIPEPKKEAIGAEEEYEPDVDFQPIVSLPEVEVITGEEGEVALFSERAKLYRNDTETKQWKERGVGMMKIMENETLKRFRILMRREQILKLCANHNIAVDMKLKPMASSERAWCWLAQDYAEEEMQNEQFAVKFKTNDEAANFKQVFERCQDKLLQYKKEAKKSGSSTENSSISSIQNIAGCNEAIAVTEPDSSESTGTVATGKSAAKQSLSELFGVNKGQWECDTCYVNNKANSNKCVSCETPKPGCENDQSEEVTSSETPTVTAPTVTATIGEKGGFTFGGFGGSGGIGKGFGSAAVSSTPAASKETSSSKTAGIGFGAADSTAAGFKFGSLVPTGNSSTSAIKSQADSTTTMPQKTSVDLSKPVQEETVSTSAGTPVKFGSTIGEPAKPSGFSFGTPSGFNFSFSETKDKETEKKTGPKPPQSPQSPGYYDNKDDVDDIYFEPIVKLPDNVELKTGEEDEEVLFVYRAKLYRFDEEWKERGLGDVKILKHRTTERCRLLMRREQIHKICMNHYIQADVELKPMAKSEGKAWIWHADDFSEGESQHEQFALRFKTEEIAAYFQTVYDCVRKNEPVPSPPEMASNEKKEPKSTPLKLDSVQPFSFTPNSSSVGFSTKFETPLSSVSSSKSEVSAATNMPASPAFSGFSFKPTSSDTPATGAKTEGFSFKTPTGGFKTSAFSGSPIVPVSSSTDSTDEAVMSSNKSSILASLLSQPASSIVSNSEVLDLSKSSPVSTDKPKVPVPTTDLDDVIYVSTEQPSAEQLAMANKYQLPPGFYLYEKRPDCKGCLGCLGDDFDFSLIGTDAKVDIPRKPGSPQKLQPKATVKAEPDTSPCFGKASQGVGDFASLAAKNTEQSFQFGQKSDTKPFAWQGVGNTLFGKSPHQGGAGGGDGEEDEDGVEQGPDIHFEPIVQLPEAVDLKTGEEDEEVVFCQRVRLYRFDNGQWKERGVGDLKVLRDQTSGRVRLLMRREQVYKVACNHALTVDMRLTRMATSETAWCWVAYDFADSEPCTQQLAARFKTKDLALQFKDVIESCQQVMRECPPKAAESKPTPSQIPTETEDPEVDTSFVTATQDVETGEGDEEEYGEEDEEYEDEYSTEEETEETPLFVKRATLFYIDAEGKPINVGMGELMVIYDDDVMAARIRMRSDDGDQVCNHIICRRYNLNIHNKEKYAEWAAQDFSTDEPEKRMFRAQFSSAVALEEFDHVFQDGLELANQSEIDEVKA